MNKLPTYDESKLIQSPFTYSLVIEATKITDSKVFIPDADGTMLPAESLIEKIQHTKIFHCTGCKEVIYNLSPGAKSLYLFILYNLDSGKDYIQLNAEWYMTKNNVKAYSTYRLAVKELLRYSFIASTEFNTVYWINPNLFFSGNRIKKFPKNVKVTGTWNK